MPPRCAWLELRRHKSGFSALRVKQTFAWSQLVYFALLYGVRHHGYCHLVIATVAIVSFGAMCRYSDVTRLRLHNNKFESDSSAF